MPDLPTWLRGDLDAAAFPYQAVLAEYHRVGKHHVPTRLLTTLDSARTRLRAVRGPDPAIRRLRRFLDTALDKHDGRYDEPTYLALSLLPIPSPDNEDWNPTAALYQHDRLLVQLVADTLRFELAAAGGSTNLLPRDRPGQPTAAMRHRHGLRAVEPAVGRLGLAARVSAADPAGAAGQLWALVDDDLTDDERLALELSMLPVYLLHDEYLFIRVLQAFEVSFALVAGYLQATVTALQHGDGPVAAALLRGAETAVTESAPLWSLLATMRVESFNVFRRWTEGASAIQSRNYKAIESLCRRPDPRRLDSPAYRSVPEIRDRVLAGQLTIDDAYRAAVTAGTASPAELGDLRQAMAAFAAALRRWRQTHYRLAVRMLGRQPGTGYTEGTPYLRRVRGLPVFHVLAGTADTATDAEPGCPFPSEQPSAVPAPTQPRADRT